MRRGRSCFLGICAGYLCATVRDILQSNRSGNHNDFAYAATHTSYESHSAIVVQIGSRETDRSVKTIGGGNESESVGMKQVVLDSNGIIRNPENLYVSVVQINL
jgi:hypothetical protein